MSRKNIRLSDLFLIFPLLICGEALAQVGPTVEEIMIRVAGNQDRAQEMRSAFVYHQDLLLRLLRGNGKTAREEEREYNVTPSPTGSQKQLTRFEGRYEKDGRLVDYHEPGFNYKDVDIDGDLIDGLADDLADDKRSRDGIAKDLFPLTTNQQKRYAFKLIGRDDYRGKSVYRITFKPIHPALTDEDGTPWEGELAVDAGDFQPVMVTTRLAKGLPVAVRTLLGTNLRGLGFKVTYDKFDEGIWFPVSYGSEFEVKALFFYKRKIAVSLRNSGFQRAKVSAKVSYDEPMQIEKSMKVQEIKAPANPPPNYR
jgi:hypothetical protein